MAVSVLGRHPWHIKSSSVFRIPYTVYLDPDCFGSLHPATLPKGFDGHSYVWDAIESVATVIANYGFSCVTQEVVAPGMTSAVPDEIRRRFARHFELVSIVTISASLNRIRHQNSQRTDHRYPDVVLERCWKAVERAAPGLGKVITIGDDDSLSDIVDSVIRTTDRERVE